MLPRNRPTASISPSTTTAWVASAGLVLQIILTHHLGLGSHDPAMGLHIATFDELQTSVDRQCSHADSEHEPVSGPKTAPASWKPNSGGYTTAGDYTQPCLNSYRWLEEQPQCRP